MKELSVQTVVLTRNLIARRLMDIDNEIEDLRNEKDQLAFSLTELPQLEEIKK